MTNIVKSITTAAFAIGLAVSAQAATVVPISAVGSSSYPGYNDFYAIDVGPGSATTDWASFGQGASSKLNLDLGGVYQLSSVSVTDRVTSGGGNGGYVGGTTDFTTSFSLTVYTDGTFTTAVGSPLVFSKPIPGSPTGVADFLSEFAVTGLSGRYVQYTVLAAGPSNNPGLSNISFTTRVPEPGTWALLVVGFGMVGFAARRRKSAVAA